MTSLFAPLCRSITLPKVLGLMLMLWTLGACAGDFVVERAVTRLVDGVYLLDAQIDYRLSQTAIEALDNGVPLTMEVHVQVRDEDAWIWEEDEADYRLRDVIRYQALSGLYEVVSLDSDRRRNFVTRDAALAALGEISGLRLIQAKRLDPRASYRVELKAELDIEALPLPLRPLAYLSPSWHLSSGWWSWHLAP